MCQLARQIIRRTLPRHLQLACPGIILAPGAKCAPYTRYTPDTGEKMTEQAIFERIKSEIETNPVTLFMKGTSEMPMCGFSAQVVAILKSYGVPFHTINVLEDYDIREGIKEFTNWPTIPQLYVKGKFIGGCDITVELHRKGELAKILKDAV
jgi:monothiol glutaredoxin